MKKKWLNNWMLKILSLLIAFTMWLVVINIEDPVDTKTFSNIKISFINTKLLTDENRVYEILEGTNVVRNVRVEAPVSVLENLNESDIVAEADFSKITVNETIEIKFYSTRFNESIRNISGSIDMVKLNIEDKKMKRFVLSTETVGTPEEGFIVGDPVVDQNRIEVSGPESVVSQIVRAGLKVDVGDSNNDISTYADVVLYDADDNVVSSPSLVMNTETVKVRVPILATKTVPIIYNVTGEPAQGYLKTDVVESNPDSVMIAGAASILAGIKGITVPGEELDVTGMTGDLARIVNVKDYIPANVSLVGGFNGKASVIVHIEEEKKRELSIPAENIHIVGTPDGYAAKLEPNVTQITVTVSGLAEDVNAIIPGLINGYIQVDNLLESQGMTEVRPGTYSAVVDFGFADGVIQKNEVRINLILETGEETAE